MATVTINRPNFLFSEVSLVLKTYGVDATTPGVVDEDDANGFAHKVLKAGTAINGVGIVFTDTDVTGKTASNQEEASVMVAGHYITANITGTLGNVAGLFGHTEPSVDRSAFAVESI